MLQHACIALVAGRFVRRNVVRCDKRPEIGVRLALGAQRRQPLAVLKDALTMIVAGMALGLMLAWGLGRLVESELDDVKPSVPLAILIAISVLASAAIAAAWIPARHASCIDPAEALRVE